MENVKKFQKSSQIIYLIGLFLLLFICFNVFISTVLFLFKISIIKATSILSMLNSTIIVVLLMHKNSLFNIKNILFTIAFSLLIIGTSIYASGKIIDYTYDGNSYHKASIGKLMDGWNPVYELVEEFDKSSDKQMFLKPSTALWSNHYAKASHIYAASIGVLTNNIESGKSINVISIIALFCFVIATALFKIKKIVPSLLFSACMISTSTISAQYLTNYVDILVYVYIFMLMAIFFAFEYNIFDTQKENLITYLIILIVVINIKFSSFVYAGLFCLGYFIWYCYRYFKKSISKKFFSSFFIVSALGVIVGGLLVGYSVYPKNFISKKHPFYPLMGEGKQDIMTNNQPAYFENKSSLEKFVIATFSKSANIYKASGLEAEYKLPFTVYEEELRTLAASDTRIGGNGVFFSGILVISFIILIIELVMIWKKDKNLFCLISIPVIITLVLIIFLGESWWARYFPQLHFIVFGSLILLLKNKNILSKILFYLVVVIVLVNNGMIFSASTKRSYDYTVATNESIKLMVNTVKDKKCDLELYSRNFAGAFYNSLPRLKDVNYIFVPSIENEEEFNYYTPYKYVYWQCK